MRALRLIRGLCWDTNLRGVLPLFSGGGLRVTMEGCAYKSAEG